MRRLLRQNTKRRASTHLTERKASPPMGEVSASIAQQTERGYKTLHRASPLRHGCAAPPLPWGEAESAACGQVGTSRYVRKKKKDRIV